MLAEKMDADTKGGSKNRAKLFQNSEKILTGVSKPPVEEVVLTSDDTTSYFVRNNNKIISVKSTKRLNTDKKMNRLDVKQENEGTEISHKRNGREKRSRIESAKNDRHEIDSKKRKTVKDTRGERKKSAPKGPLDLINELNCSDDDDEQLSENGNETFEIEPILSDRKMKFGIPTIIRGSPANTYKWPLTNSPVSSTNPTSTKFNLRGNFLSNLCYDRGGTSEIFKSPTMVSKVQVVDLEPQDDEEAEEICAEASEETEESPNYDSDISLITEVEKPESNPDFESVELENDSIDKPEFYSLQNKVIAIMGPSTKFYFNGKIRVKVLVGKVEIYGYVFGRRETVVPAEIYSPRGSSLICVETLQDYAEESIGGLHDLLTHEGINHGVATDMENRLENLPDGQTVLILENLENTLTKYLDFYCPHKLFPKTEDSTTYHNRHPKKAEKQLQSVFQYDDSGKRLRKDDYRESNITKKILEQSSSGIPQRILIAGGKGVGKSTTLRYLVNGLLPANEEIVVVDFDPGQPEFTPPGCISVNIIDRPLTGPNYTHLRTPFYQIFIGDVNVARCVPRYVQAAKKLVKFLNESERLKNRTVIINTMGFCEGIGLDLMVYIIKLVHPSTVLQINSERQKNNFRHLLSSEVINDQVPFVIDVEDQVIILSCHMTNRNFVSNQIYRIRLDSPAEKANFRYGRSRAITNYT